MPFSQIAENVKAALPIKFHKVIDTRVQLGWKKYGQSLDDNIKTERQKAVHLLMELFDALQYLEWGAVVGTWDYEQAFQEVLNVVYTVHARFPDLTFEEMDWREGYQE